MASAAVRMPNTRNGCAEAWYLTSFFMGSTRKNLNCAYTWCTPGWATVDASTWAVQ